MKKSFKEIRLHRGKPPQEFLCHLLHQEKDYLVLRYVNPSSAKINDIHIKKGSITIAHYWKHRNYILWKMKEPDGELKGYLFHISKNTDIGDNSRWRRDNLNKRKALSFYKRLIGAYNFIGIKTYL